MGVGIAYQKAKTQMLQIVAGNAYPTKAAQRMKSSGQIIFNLF
jgi:hypothetical protein